MAYFLALCTDKPGALDLRLATRPAHLDWIKAKGDAVRLGGAFVEGDAVGGSLLVVEAEDMDAAVALLEEDPYGKVALFESVVVREWRWVVGNPHI